MSPSTVPARLTERARGSGNISPETTQNTAMGKVTAKDFSTNSAIITAMAPTVFFGSTATMASVLKSAELNNSQHSRKSIRHRGSSRSS